MGRRQHSDTAPDRNLSSDIVSNPTQISINNDSGWPAGTTPFIITIDPDNAKEEKKLVTRTAGSTILDVVQNGFGGTVPTNHFAGAVVRHSISGVDLNEANRLVNLADAKGDTIAATGADTWERKPAPADGQLFVADAAEADGWKPTTGTPNINAYLRGDRTWGPVVSADALNALSRKANGLFVPQGMELIDEQILSLDAANVEFLAIPQTFRHLLILYSARGTAASTVENLLIRVNGLAGGEYDSQRFVIAGVGTAASRNVNQNQLFAGVVTAAAAADSANFASGEFWINDYSSTRDKAVRGTGDNDRGDVPEIWLEYGNVDIGGVAVTSVRLFPAAGNLLAGSSFGLYGLRGE